MEGLALGVALTVVTTALLAYTGVIVSRRPVTVRARLARTMFVTWWFSAAAIILLAGSHTILALLGVTDLRLHVAITYLTAVPLAVGLWSLLYYLIYILTGRHAAIWPLTVAYALFFVFEIYYFAALGQRALETTPWSVRLARASDPPAGVGELFGILVAAPVIFIILAYARLLAGVREPEQRFRARMTAAAFGLWFTPVLVGFLLGWDAAAWFPLLYQVPGLVAAMMIVAAHHPPRRLQDRWRSARFDLGT